MTAQQKHRNISEVTDQYLCNSCGACAVSCFQNAIRFKESVAGYLFPQIDDKSCTNCQLCYQVCPGIGFGTSLCDQIPDDPFVGQILACEVGRSTDKDIFANSQSGGVATALLQHLFLSREIEAAIVATMRPGSPPRGEALVIQSVSELLQAQKSKYTPIPMLNAIRDVQSINGPIALVGLPCHMHGLGNLQDHLPTIRKKIIIKIGLICDRIMLSSAIDFMTKYATEKPINQFTFRDKNYFEYPGNSVAYEVGGNKIILDSSLRTSIKDHFTPARCRLCFDKMNVFADVVCGDPYGIADVDRQRGETLVISRTQVGKNIVEQAKVSGLVLLRNAPVEAALRGQGIKKKRASWEAYMSAWNAMGRELPNYSVTFSANSQTSEQKKWLKHALNIDSFHSPSYLMKTAKNDLFKRKILKAVSSPLKTINKSLRKKKLGLK